MSGSREGGLQFSHVFTEDTEVTGHMKLKLWVSTTEGDDMDLFVAVEKLDRTGEEVHFFGKTGYAEGPVALGWLRVSERTLDAVASTPWQPVLSHDNPSPIAAGEIVPVEIEILPSSTRFLAGETLRLTIQGRDLFEHPALAHAYSANEGTHRIHSGRDHDSHLLLPIAPASD